MRNRTSMSPWVIIYRSLWGILSVLVMVGLLCVFLPKCHEIRELQRRKAELQDQNHATEQTVKELRLKQERFETEPAYVERIAREEGMVRRDEIVFRFTNASAGAREGDTP